MNNGQKAIQYLKNNIPLLIGHISIDYPISYQFISLHEQLLDWQEMVYNEKITYTFDFCKQYRDRISWKEFTSSHIQDSVYNEDHLWTEEFLEEFKDVVDWSSISYGGNDIILSNNAISHFKDYIDWFNLSVNPYINISEELLEKYIDKWDWNEISQNEHLPWSLRLIVKFKEKWNWKYFQYNHGIPWTPEILDEIGQYLDEKEIRYLRKHCLETNKSFNELYPISARLKERNIEIYSDNEFNAMLKEFDPIKRSDDIRIPWTPGLIKYYKDEWDWETLSANEKLPWSEELIDLYIDKWFWGNIIPDPDSGIEGYQTSSIYKGVSNIEAIQWTHRMINKYKDFLFWDNFCYNQSIEWTIDLLEEYYLLMNPNRLCQSRKLWETVFYPYLNEEVISEILLSVQHN